jgi:thiosulfate/3-mercaptopyruvate sulfurtransferase
MLKNLGFLLIASALQAFSAGSAQASVLPGAQVDATWLHAHADAVQIVDVRDDLNSLTDSPKYQTVGGAKVLSQVGGYIPGALSVNFWALRVKRPIGGKDVDFLLPTAAEFEEVMQASQLEPGKPVVVVPTGDDATSLQEAALLVWELELYGMPADQVAMLDGGTHAWIAAGFAVDDDAIAPMSSGHWKASAPRAAMMADVDQVRAAQRAHAPLLDARPLAQFAGVDHTPVVPVAGRLAGARPLPAELLYRRADDGSWRFLSAAQYRAVFALDQLRLPAHPIVYCNTGQYAAGAWFVLERILHRRGVREYQGGMNEWIARGLPVSGL